MLLIRHLWMWFHHEMKFKGFIVTIFVYLTLSGKKITFILADSCLYKIDEFVVILTIKLKDFLIYI